MPKRIQRRRTKGWRMPEGAIYVGRPTQWGNPLYAGMWTGYTKADACRDYRKWIMRDLSVITFDNAFGKPPSLFDIRLHLAGQDLCCWCPLDQECHGDILLEFANAKG